MKGPISNHIGKGSGHIEGIPVEDCTDVIIESGASIGGHLVASTIERNRFCDQVSATSTAMLVETAATLATSPSSAGVFVTMPSLGTGSSSCPTTSWGSWFLVRVPGNRCYCKVDTFVD